MCQNDADGMANSVDPDQTSLYMLSNETLRFLSEIEIGITTGGH